MIATSNSWGGEIENPPIDFKKFIPPATKRGSVPPDLTATFVMWLGLLLGGVMALAAAVL